MKKPVYSSNLALRFYFRDGWTVEELKACLKTGAVQFKSTDRYEQRYMTLDHTKGSQFDIDKLMEKVSEVVRFGGYTGTETDREYLSRMNW